MAIKRLVSDAEGLATYLKKLDADMDKRSEQADYSDLAMYARQAESLGKELRDLYQHSLKMKHSYTPKLEKMHECIRSD